GRQPPGRRFQAGRARPGNRLLTGTLQPRSPATLRVFALIRDTADHRRRSLSVYGPTLTASLLVPSMVAPSYAQSNARVPKLWLGRSAIGLGNRRYSCRAAVPTLRQMRSLPRGIRHA